jgi:hypothetical protein
MSTRSNRLLGALSVGAITLGGAAIATAAPNPAGAPASAIVDCRVDGLACETPELLGPGGSRVQLAIQDDDTATARLTARFVTPTLTCADRGYTPTSDQVVFDITRYSTTSARPLVKTLTMTMPIGSRSTDASTYHVCFAAPYRFPAVDLRPGELAADTQRGDFSRNTNRIADIGNGVSGHSGILPLCSAGIRANSRAGEAHSPCVSSRTVDLSASTVTVVIEVPAADPAMRA